LSARASLLEYSGHLVTLMTNPYRIESLGNEFMVLDDAGETVGVFPSRDAALQDIERCEKEDAMWDTAKLLVRAAIEKHMQMHGVENFNLLD
jgi:hypothetical protein